MIVEPFRAQHLQTLIAQGVQSSQLREISHASTFGGVECPLGTSLTARDGNRIILCGGMIPTAPHMGILWAALSADAGQRMLWLHRATLRFLDIKPLRRIEATVEDGFSAGCRWLELLGFEYEGRMRGYGLDGETHLRYGRIR